MMEKNNKQISVPLYAAPAGAGALRQSNTWYVTIKKGKSHLRPAPPRPALPRPPLPPQGAVGREPLEDGIDGRYHPALQGQDGLPQGHALGAPGQVRVSRPRGALDRQARVRGGQRGLHPVLREGDGLLNQQTNKNNKIANARY